MQYLSFVLQTFLAKTNTNINDFVYGKGKRKSQNQRLYEEMKSFLDSLERLIKYSYCIKTCGDHKNSYSKTDKDATFM